MRIGLCQSSNLSQPFATFLQRECPTTAAIYETQNTVRALLQSTAELTETCEANNNGWLFLLVNKVGERGVAVHSLDGTELLVS